MTSLDMQDPIGLMFNYEWNPGYTCFLHLWCIYTCA